MMIVFYHIFRTMSAAYSQDPRPYLRLSRKRTSHDQTLIIWQFIKQFISLQELDAAYPARKTHKDVRYRRDGYRWTEGESLKERVKDVRMVWTQAVCTVAHCPEKIPILTYFFKVTMDCPVYQRHPASS